MELESKQMKTGFIGLVGPTNSGKSTLLNTLIGEKLSIVSPRAQTTYHGVKGILNLPDAQLVFVDTPGFQRHTERLARLLNKVADRSKDECDVLVWIFDASNPSAFKHCLALKDKVAKHKTPEANICVLNKVDKVAKEELLPLMQALFELSIFREIIPISAKTGDGVQSIVETLKNLLPMGTPMYPLDMITDRTQQFLVSEMVREKIYHATKQEIPYCARVEIEGWEEPGEGQRYPTIRVVIHVDSDSRKGILIGKGGEMLKRIGQTARVDVEHHLQTQVVMKLFVHVEKEWKNDERQLNTYLEL